MYWNQGPTPPPQAPQHMYQYPLMAQRFNNPPITNPAKRCQRQPYAGANQSFGSQMPMMPDFIEQKLMDMKKLPEIYLFDFENPGLDKKWSSPREDITDYFNYGFTEETWRIYAEKVKNLHEQVQPCPKPDKSQRVLGYTPPIDIGGFGEPYFPEAKDTPFMKVVNRNKESVMYMLSKNPYHSLEILLERALLDPRVIPVEQSLRKLYDEIKPGMLTLKRKLPMEYLSFLAQSQNITAGAECAYTPKYNPLRSKPAPQPKALLPAPASSSTHTPPTNPTPPIPPTPATPPQLPKSSSTPTPKPSTPPPNPTRPTPTLPPKPFPRSPKPFSHHPQPQTHQPQPHHHQSIDISSLALILSMRDRLIAKSMIDDNNDTCDDDVRRKRRLSTSSSSSSSSVMRKGKGKRSTGSSSSSSSSSGGSKGSGRKSDRSGSKGDKKGREAGKGEVKRNERRERQGEGKKEGERDRKREEEVKKKDAEKKAVIREHEREDRGSGSTKKRRRGRGRDKGQKNGHDNLDRRRRSNDKKDSRRSKEKSDIKKDKVNKDERTGQKDHKRRENESHTHSGRDNRIGENELSVKRKESSKQKRSSREKTENKSQRSDEFRLEKPKVAKKNQIDEKEAHLGKRSEFLDDNEKSVSQKPKLKMKRNRSESSSRESSRSHRNRNDKDTNKKPTKSSAHASSSQLPSNSNRKVRDEDHHQDRHNPKTSNSSKGESSIHERINPKPVPQTQSSTFKKPIKPVHHKRR